MATMYYCVFEDAGAVAAGTPVQEGKVNIGAGSTQSSAISNGNREVKAKMIVRVFCDAKAFVTWGANPTAASDGSDGRPMGSENPEYFQVQAGHLLAVIQRA